MMGKITAICLGMAVGMHAYMMLFFVGDHGYGSRSDAAKAVDAMMILAFIMYTFAFVLSLVQATGEDAGPLTCLTKPIVITVLAILGVICFVVGITVLGTVSEFKWIDWNQLIAPTTVISMAAFLALLGGIVVLRNGGGGYSRELNHGRPEGV